jgi:uncharacterized protein (DUF885 family)
MRQTSILALLMLLVAGTAFAAGEDLAARREEILAKVDALKTNAAGLSEPEKLHAFIDLYRDYILNQNPEFATYLGLPMGQDRWTDQSLAAIEQGKQDLFRGSAVFDSFDRGALSGDDRLNYDLIKDRLDSSREGLRFHEEYLAVSQLGGVQQNVPQVLAMTRTTGAGDYENILARLRAVPTLVEQNLALLEAGRKAGITPPRVTLRDVPEQVANLLVDDPLTSPMLKAFTHFPDGVPAAEQERLKGEAVKVFREQVAPAFSRLHDYLVDTYIPAARETIGMSALPDGDAWYRFLIKQYTTTDMTAQQIHALGLSEVKRIRQEMDQVIKDSGFTGSFAEFSEFLRTDPRFYFKTPEELVAAYRNIAKRADPELVKLFGHLPELTYGVIEVPAYMAKSQTTAYYEGGSLEGGRPGYFYVNTYDLPSRPSWEMEALTLHEAVPGHHLQISIAQELKDLPWFRRFGGYTAFVEGWGLYAESLGEKMGFYEDPYSKFGELTYEMWRAIRLVVDTGIHSMGWSRQQAIDYFEENASKTEHDVVVEVDRYIVNPGQALAYKIGELKIKELRDYAQGELGDRFDIRAFHDEVLGAGALPLSVLETRIREWVAAQKGS